MPIPMLDNVDFNKNQTLNRRLQQLGTAPSSPVEGQEYWNTVSKRPFFHDGTAWVTPYDRSAHFGTQLAATISDLAATVQAYRLDQFAAPTADVSFGGVKITNLADPVGNGDAVNKGYVDAQSQGFKPKGSVTAATVAALSPANTYANGSSGAGATLTATSNGVLTVDGYATVLNDLILVKDEASGLKNGIYKVTTEGTAGVPYVLTRVTNMDVSAEFNGAYVVVETESTTLAGAIFLCNQTSPTVGTTSISFTRINTPTTYNGDGSTVSVSSNTISIAAGYVGQTSITTLGTVTTGTWNGATIAIANGGTGQTTATAAFNALSPLTTLGDTLYGGAAGAAQRLAGNVTTTKQFLNQTGDGTNSAAPTWSALASGDIPNLPASKITSGQLPITNGGTGASTAAGARAALGVAGKFAADIGDGSSTTITVTHNLNTKDVVVSLRDNATDTMAYATVVAATVNTVTITFAVAPATDAYRVVVHG